MYSNHGINSIHLAALGSSSLRRQVVLTGSFFTGRGCGFFRNQETSLLRVIGFVLLGLVRGICSCFILCLFLASSRLIFLDFAQESVLFWGLLNLAAL